MTRLAPFALAALLAASPAFAQEESGGDLIDRGTDLLFQGIREQADAVTDRVAGISAELLPTFRLLAQEMGPAFVDVFGRIDSIQNYEPPAILPNGDIVLRRRPGAPHWTPADAAQPEAVR